MVKKYSPARVLVAALHIMIFSFPSKKGKTTFV